MRSLCYGRWSVLLALAVITGSAGPVLAQTLYKYQGPDGEWIYADRPPADGKIDEVRTLNDRRPGTLSVDVQDMGREVRFSANNPYYAPVELRLRFTSIAGFDYSDSGDQLRWVVPSSSHLPLLSLQKVGAAAPSANYEIEYTIGDPSSRHAADVLYRVPFGLATNFLITQAYPDTVTHTTPDSRYAVDIAMPIGTNIFAARDGVVFDVSSDNFKSGTDPVGDGPAANVVQILHEDGTYAVYAHLNWNSIRVQAGDHVVRGQYIADSGNTGFSTGPHLHFAVLKNAGMQITSLPVSFQGSHNDAVRPLSGNRITAY